LISFLYSIDVAVFRWINETWSCPFLDQFFSYLTQFRHFEWPVLLWALYLLIWGKAKGRWLVFTVVITVLLTDQISAHLIKHLVERVRPCNALPGVLTPAGASSAFSFPSSHAANMGGSMLVLSRAFPIFTWLFTLIALLVGLSRVYLGLHYPSDVLSGYVLGIVIGWGVLKIITSRFKNANSSFTTKAPRHQERHLFSLNFKSFISSVFLVPSRLGGEKGFKMTDKRVQSNVVKSKPDLGKARGRKKRR